MHLDRLFKCASLRLAGLSGARVLMVHARSDRDSDFLTSLEEVAVGSPMATGALLLPPVR